MAEFRPLSRKPCEPGVWGNRTLVVDDRSMGGQAQNRSGDPAMATTVSDLIIDQGGGDGKARTMWKQFPCCSTRQMLWSRLPTASSSVHSKPERLPYKLSRPPRGTVNHCLTAGDEYI